MSATVWSKFYWSDWANDPGLKLCSLGAQGLWMRMLCVAAEHDPTGYVMVNGKPCDAAALARLTGTLVDEVQAYLDELEGYGVFSRDRQGTIYSRRMINDAKRAKNAAKNGRKGGNPTLKKNENESRTTRGNKTENQAPDNQTPKQEDKPPDKGRDKTHMPYANSHTPYSPPAGDGVGGVGQDDDPVDIPPFLRRTPDGKRPADDTPQNRAQHDQWRDDLETACGVDLSKSTSPGDHRAFEAMVGMAIDSGLARRLITEKLTEARKSRGDKQPGSPGPYWRKVLERIIAEEAGQGGADDDSPPIDRDLDAAQLRALRVRNYDPATWDTSRKGPVPTEQERMAAASWSGEGRPPEIFFQSSSKARVGR